MWGKGFHRFEKGGRYFQEMAKFVDWLMAKGQNWDGDITQDHHDDLGLEEKQGLSHMSGFSICAVVPRKEEGSLLIEFHSSHHK